MIEAMLWDCDGVLQHPDHGWDAALAAVGGPDFAQELYAAELPALRGERSLRAVVTDLLVDHPRLQVEEVLDLWRRFEPDEAAWQVVDDVRAAGFRCVLATNQQDFRRDLMRDELRYDERVDGTYYSCEVGAMKPDPDYFTRVLADLGIEAGQALFIDDSARNVDAAKALGLNVIHHDPRTGAAELRREVAPYLHP